jgi:PilZ domain
VKPDLRVEHRRAHLRFEVLGTLSASIVSTERLEVVNIGASGALVQSTLPLPLHAEYEMQLVVDDHVSEVTVKVRRVSAAHPGPGGSRYEMGVEFLTISAETEEVLNQIVLASQAQV